MTDEPLPRGLRVNNPLNLKELPGDETQWIGERATDDDPHFEEFVTMAHGVRAGAIALRNYQRLHGIRTLEGIIHRWAPANDRNDPVGYIEYMRHRTSFAPRAELDLERWRYVRPIVEAIILFEQGRPIEPAIIDEGLRMAGFRPEPDAVA